MERIKVQRALRKAIAELPQMQNPPQYDYSKTLWTYLDETFYPNTESESRVLIQLIQKMRDVPREVKNDLYEELKDNIDGFQAYYRRCMKCKSLINDTHQDFVQRKALLENAKLFSSSFAVLELNILTKLLAKKVD